VTGSATASIGSGIVDDCAGVSGGSAYINACGWCVEGTTGLPADYGKFTCWDGSTVCTGTSGSVPVEACIDCDGVPTGSAYINDCGWCVGGTTGKPADYGKFTCWDGTLVCTGTSGSVPVEACIDCDGVPTGSAYINDCGFCVGGATGRADDYGKMLCFDGSLVCSASQSPVSVASCPAPIYSGSVESFAVSTDYTLDLSRNASVQRERRIQQVPFILATKTAMAIRRTADSQFSGSS